MYDFYKKCEVSLKNKIIELYGNFFNETKLNAFKNKEYITDYVMSIKRLSELFDYLSDKMLDDLLTLMCTKRQKINEDTDINILCGASLKTALKNYYKLAISKKIPYDTKINYEYAYDIDTINFLNTYFDNIVDKNVFNKTALELEQIEELSSYVEMKLSKDIENYIENNSIVK